MLTSKNPCRSLKEVIKALIVALAKDVPSHTLPESLQEVIQAYLDKHQNIDESDSVRLHEELLNLYQKYVATDPARHALFLAALRPLKVAIKKADRLLQWWDLLVRPTIDSLSQEKAVVADARAITLSILIYEDDEDTDGERGRASAMFTQKLLELYLEKTKFHSNEGESFLENDERNRFIANNVESVLVAFGRKRPRDFLNAIDVHIVEKDHRLQALSLLCTFVRFQPPHLHQVLETSLFDHLLTCLTIDTSRTVISSGLTALVMFLPHIPDSLGPYLSRLFIVYSRILCWDRFHQKPDVGSDNGDSKEIDNEKNNSFSSNENEMVSDPSWKRLDSSFDTTSSTTPDLSHYFTFLYGLYPINFTSFIRKPYKYLKNDGFPRSNEVDIDEPAVTQRTDQFRQFSLLHPNFYTMTAESELTDMSRWIKLEPMDVIAQCMGLSAAPSQPSVLDDPGPPPTSKLPDIPEAFVSTDDIPSHSLLNDEDGTADGATSPNESRNNWRNTQSTAVTSHYSYGGEPGAITKVSLNQFPSTRSNGTSRRSSPGYKARDTVLDSPTLPPQYGAPEQKLQDMLHLQESLRSNAHQIPNNDSAQSLHTQETSSPRLEAYIQSVAQGTVPRSPAQGPQVPDVQANIAFLQREVMLLRNDLNFERYLKSQHLSHIGQLQRKHIKEATIEAETQNILNNNRALKLRIEEQKKKHEMLKFETTTSKNHAKKWEGDLNSKIRILREDQKKWKAEEETIRNQLRASRQECDQLRRIIVESEAKELLSRQKVQSFQQTLGEMDNLRFQVEKLSTRLAESESKEDEFALARENEEHALAQLERMRIKLKARDGERTKMQKAYDGRIYELESQLSRASTNIAAGAPPQFQAMLDSALAASHSRFAQLKKAHNHLLSRHTDLERRYLDLQAAGEPSSAPSSNSHSFGRAVSHFNDDFSPIDEDDSPTDHRSRDFSDPGTEIDRYPMGQPSSSTRNPIAISSSYPDPRSRFDSRMPAEYRHNSRLESTYQYVHSPTSNPSSPIGHSELSGNSLPFDAAAGPLKRETTDMSGVNDTGSVHSDNSRKNSKSKIAPNSEIRIRGRGGVQNIGKKEKEKKAALAAKEAKKSGVNSAFSLSSFRSKT
jgi:solute carrier family 25 (mitochondrial carrier protein), member 16